MGIKPDDLGTFILAASICLGVVISLSKLIGSPIAELKLTITALTEQIKSVSTTLTGIKKDMADFKLVNTTSHKELRDKDEEQDDMLNDHETRLVVLEAVNKRRKDN